ncbi:MAG TPA: phosphatase PAP2 family protein [Verrucomicrobiae bacterium]
MADKNTWRAKLRAVLPHEWIFGAYLLLTGLRLFVHGGAARPWAFLFFGCVLASIAVFFWAENNLTPWRWRVRLLFYPASMGISFYAMGVAVPLLGHPKVDTLLLGWDRALIGETPAVAWEHLLRPWAEDVAMAGYLFFFYYLVAGPAVYCIRDLRLFRKCIVGLFTMYGLAFMSYTVMPAGGPWRWMTFQTPLHGPWLLDWVLKPVNAGSNAVDVFPSVHLAATLYLLLFDWQHGRRRFWWYLLPCFVLWFATMYLRFHYFVDLLAGAAMALAGWWMANKYAAATAEQPMFTAEVRSKLQPQK